MRGALGHIGKQSVVRVIDFCDVFLYGFCLLVWCVVFCFKTTFPQTEGHSSSSGPLCTFPFCKGAFLSTWNA